MCRGVSLLKWGDAKVIKNEFPVRSNDGRESMTYFWHCLPVLAAMLSFYSFKDEDTLEKEGMGYTDKVAYVSLAAS